jgi:N-acetylmuramoyl-L-alanine amidase
MPSAGSRLAALGGALLLAFASASATGGATVAARQAQTEPVRSAPSRPGTTVAPGPAASPGGISVPSPAAIAANQATQLRNAPPLPITRIKTIDYIGVTEMAVRLGYRGRLNSSKRELTLTSGTRKVVLTMDSREVACDGVRIFLGDAVQARNAKFYLSKTDYERCLLPLLRPEAVTALVPRLRTIVIDPGHGGSDPGMENPRLRLQEKVLTLDVALRLEKLLKADGYTVVLTRRDDRQLAPNKDADLQRRAIVANAALADLFLSIHFNSLYPDTKVNGTEVFVFTRPGQRSDQSWGFGQSNDTETDISPVNRSDPWSSLLAHEIHRDVLATLKTDDRGHKTKHLAALRGLNCPGVLVESLFLSNETEARRAATAAYRQQIAESLASGIRSYAAALDSLRPKSPPPSATSARPASSNSP